MTNSRLAAALLSASILAVLCLVRAQADPGGGQPVMVPEAGLKLLAKTAPQLRGLRDGSIYYLSSGSGPLGLPRNIYKIPLQGGMAEPLLAREQDRQEVDPSGLAVDGLHGRIGFFFVPARSGSADSFNRLMLLDAGSTTPRLLVDNGRYNCNAVFSPDGTKLAFFSCRPDVWSNTYDRAGGYTLRVVDLQSKTERELSAPGLRPLPGDVLYPAWSPDSKSVAFAAAVRGCKGIPVHVAAADGTTSRTLGEGYEVHSVVWPRPGHILFTSLAEPGVHRVDVASGRVQRTLPGTSGLRSTLSFSPDRQLVAVQSIEQGSGETTSTLLTPEGQPAPAGTRAELVHGLWRQ